MDTKEIIHDTVERSFNLGFNAGLDKFKQDFDTRMDKIDAMLADMVRMLEDLK